jgi:hypothetical protein
MLKDGRIVCSKADARLSKQTAQASVDGQSQCRFRIVRVRWFEYRERRQGLVKSSSFPNTSLLLNLKDLPLVQWQDKDASRASKQVPRLDGDAARETYSVT